MVYAPRCSSIRRTTLLPVAIFPVRPITNFPGQLLTETPLSSVSRSLLILPLVRRITKRFDGYASIHNKTEKLREPFESCQLLLTLRCLACMILLPQVGWAIAVLRCRGRGKSALHRARRRIAPGAGNPP